VLKFLSDAVLVLFTTKTERATCASLGNFAA